MKRTESNGYSIYHLHESKSIPEFLKQVKASNKTVSSLRHDAEYRDRLSLLHDLHFEASSVSMDFSEDGDYLVVSGVYPPEIKVFDLRELSLKFSRKFNSEAVQVFFLSPDYSKIVILRCDKFIEFHAQYGRHFELRLPTYARSMCYDSSTCILYILSGSSNEIYRLDLEEGIFLETFKVDGIEEGISCAALAPLGLPFLYVGAEDAIYVLDTREGRVISKLSLGEDRSPCSLALLGMKMAVGCDNGEVLVFDIRSSKPVYKYDHKNQSSIDCVIFYNEDMVVSSDHKSIKAFNRGSLEFSIETKHKPNQLKFYPNSSLLFSCQENSKVGLYYIPQLNNPTPKFASFLDSIITNMASDTTNTTDKDMLFITAAELEGINGSSYVGSDLVKQHLHGFYIDYKLYKKLKAESNYGSAAYEEELLQKQKDLIAQKTSMRKPAKAKSAKLTQNEKLQKNTSLLDDSRFNKLFNNPDFQIE